MEQDPCGFGRHQFALPSTLPRFRRLVDFAVLWRLGLVTIVAITVWVIRSHGSVCDFIYLPWIIRLCWQWTDEHSDPSPRGSTLLG